MEKVSIVLRTNERYLLLDRALEDIMMQTFRDWKIILVNDGGDIEKISNLIRKNSIPANKIKIVHLKENKGLNIAINAGAKEVEGEYVVIHDDDDTWHETFLDRTVSFLDENKEYGGVITHTIQIVEEIENNRVKIIKEKDFNSNVRGVISFNEILKNNLFSPISFLYRSRVYKEIGLYDENLKVLEDWDFNIRLMSKYDIGIIEEPLANYHIRKQKNLQSVFQNTITHRRRDHLKYDSIIRNKYLRQDIANNQIGIGVMMNILKWSDTRLMRYAKKVIKR